MRILIVKLGAIGDVVHTLPSLAAIRAALPEADISWVAESRSAEILRGNSLIDRLVEVDTRNLRKRGSPTYFLSELNKQVGEIRRVPADIALDFQGLLKSAAIARLSGARRRWGFARADLREPAGRLFLTDTVGIPAETHVILKNLLLAQNALEIPVPKSAFEFPIFTSEADRAEAGRIISQSGPEFAVVNPAGGWVTKLWHPEKYGRLADRLWQDVGLKTVVTTGPGEDHLSGAAMASSCSEKAFPAQPTLKGFFELVKRASIYIGGDTGPTHLAIAAGTPVVGIFGPTEWWRNGSIDPRDVCVERNDIGCRVACHRRTCSNWICMDIPVEAVLEAVRVRIGAAAVR